MAILKRLGPTSLHLCSPYISLKKEAPKTNLYSPIKILLVRKWALQRLLIVMLTGFGIGIVYYSMPLAVGNLGFNVYLSVAFNALAEIPSYIIFSLSSYRKQMEQKGISSCIHYIRWHLQHNVHHELEGSTGANWTGAETRGVALSDTMDEQEEKEQLAM
ncbi:hypothetical protein POTOM_052426 [Populus tomentosa]|uniref:Uncharacterized protein n=1 Tax=Populus tomentosa TaxID=118781 RepID=A0A8X7YE43_POPTO|nr:hypothetical protein POTOM_052426 [Populus tomentosa]